MGDALDREAALRARVAKLEVEALDEIARLSPVRPAAMRRTAVAQTQGTRPNERETDTMVGQQRAWANTR